MDAAHQAELTSGLCRGNILSSHSLGNTSLATDVSIFTSEASKVDWMYVNAPAYHSVHAYKITAPGNFELFQRYGLGDMPSELFSTPGFAVSRYLGWGRLKQG